jgi:hypothetical protein
VIGTLILAVVIISIEVTVHYFIMESFYRYWYDFSESLMLVSPMGPLYDLLDSYSFSSNDIKFSGGSIVIAAMNILIGLVFIIRAKTNIRKNIF